MARGRSCSTDLRKVLGPKIKPAQSVFRLLTLMLLKLIFFFFLQWRLKPAQLSVVPSFVSYLRLDATAWAKQSVLGGIC